MINFNDYNTGEGIIPANTFKISPSQFALFFSSPNLWFRRGFLGEEGFTGNTGSHLGNIIHEACERTAMIQDMFTEADVDKYIASLDITKIDIYGNLITDPFEIDRCWQQMLAVATQYVETLDITKTEEYIWFPISDKVTIAGSIDALRSDIETNGRIVMDYKTTYEKLPPKKIKYEHKLQAWIYAWIYRQMGIHISHIEIVYITRPYDGVVSLKTGKTGKAYPATCTPIIEPFTDADYDMINSFMKLTTETMEYFFEHPETAYLLFKDYRLKGREFDVSQYKSNLEQELF